YDRKCVVPVILLYLQQYDSHQDLHSFPTRRSSDLLLARAGQRLGQVRPGRLDHGALLGELAVDRRRLQLDDELPGGDVLPFIGEDRKSTRLNSSHSQISYAVFCLKKKNIDTHTYNI